MSTVISSADVEISIRDLRERAALARRIAKELSDEEAAKRLTKHAEDLERQLKTLGGTSHQF